MVDLEIYDCTMREGEQAAGASFNLAGRIELFKLLDDLGVDYIEVGWPNISEEIKESIKKCKEIRKNAKISAFGSTSRHLNVESDKNLLEIIDSSADCACIFGKSWLEHVKLQLKISPQENLKKIEESVYFLKRKGMEEVFYDAEH